MESFWRDARRAAPSRGKAIDRALFLVSPSTTPCGVEMFARRLARTWENIGCAENSVAICGRLRDIPALWRALNDVDALVVNFPVVAWKRVLLTPLLAFVLALARGKRTILVAHEWDDSRLAATRRAGRLRAIRKSHHAVVAHGAEPVSSGRFGAVVWRADVDRDDTAEHRARAGGRAKRDGGAHRGATRRQDRHWPFRVDLPQKTVRFRADGRRRTQAAWPGCARRVRGRVCKGPGFRRAGLFGATASARFSRTT